MKIRLFVFILSVFVLTVYAQKSFNLPGSAGVSNSSTVQSVYTPPPPGQGGSGTTSYYYSLEGNAGTFNHNSNNGNRIDVPSSAQVNLNKFTGTPSIRIPLFNIKSRKLEVPISANYSSSGTRTDDVAGLIGLGWDLNSGGSISRQVNGLPDETFSLGYIFHVDDVQALAANPTGVLANMPAYDTEPDEFYFSFNGHSGKFILGPNGTAKTIPHSSLRITYSTSYDRLLDFTITDESGTIYRFGGNDDAIESTIVEEITYPFTPDLEYETWGDPAADAPYQAKLADYNGLLNVMRPLIDSYNQLIEEYDFLQSYRCRHELDQYCETICEDGWCRLGYSQQHQSDLAAVESQLQELLADLDPLIALKEELEAELEVLEEAFQLTQNPLVINSLGGMRATLIDISPLKFRWRQRTVSTTTYDTKWYLTRIEDHNQTDHITINYIDQGTNTAFYIAPEVALVEPYLKKTPYFAGDFTGYFFQDVANNLPGQAPQDPDQIINLSSTNPLIKGEDASAYGATQYFSYVKNIVDQKVINSIETASGNTVWFIKSQTRLDLPGAFQLDAIEVYNIDNQLINRFEFTYENVLSKYADLVNDPYSKLEFSIVNDLLYHLDFGNAAPLSTSILNEGSFKSQIDQLGEFETVEYKFLDKTISKENFYRLFLVGIEETGNTACRDEFSLKPYRFEYTSPEDLPRRTSLMKDVFGYTIDYNPQTTPSNALRRNLYTIDDFPVGTSHPELGMISKVTYPTGGSKVFVYENHVAVNNVSVQPGVRVRKILNYTYDQTLNSASHYQYDKGIFYSQETRQVTYQNLYFDMGIGKVRKTTTFNQDNFQVVKGGLIGYGEIRMYKNNNADNILGNNGYSIYTYSNPGVNANGQLLTNFNNDVYGEDFTGPLQSIFPFPKQNDQQHRFGNLLKEEVFNTDDELVYKAEYQYAVDQFTDDIYGVLIDTTLDTNRLGIYAYENDWARLFRITNTQYPDGNPSNALVRIKDMIFSSSTHQLRSMHTSNSEGDNEAIQYIYAENISNYDDVDWLKAMVDRHILDQPIEVTSQVVNDPILDFSVLPPVLKEGASHRAIPEKTVRVYRMDGNQLNLDGIYRSHLDEDELNPLLDFSPSKVVAGVFTFDDRLHDEVRFGLYDVHGNPLLIRTHNGINTVKYYDYNSGAPVCKIHDGRLSTFSYTSFEGDIGSEALWDYDINNVTTDYSKTGQKSYRGRVSLTNINQGDYILSYWARGQVNVSVKENHGTLKSNLTYASGDDNWTYYEMVFHHEFDPVDVFKPVFNPDEPVFKPDEPVLNPDKPVFNPNDPDKPVFNPDKPVFNPDDPGKPVFNPDLPPKGQWIEDPDPGEQEVIPICQACCESKKCAERAVNEKQLEDKRNEEKAEREKRDIAFMEKELAELAALKKFGTGGGLPQSELLRITTTGLAYIDELRLYPIDLQMTSTAYKYGVGVSETCDENGNVQHFSYDNHNRLNNIRDTDKNIQQQNDYGISSGTTLTFGGFTGLNSNAQMITVGCNREYFVLTDAAFVQDFELYIPCTKMFTKVEIDNVVHALPYTAPDGTHWEKIETSGEANFILRVTSIAGPAKFRIPIQQNVIPCPNSGL